MNRFACTAPFLACLRQSPKASVLAFLTTLLTCLSVVLTTANASANSNTQDASQASKSESRAQGLPTPERAHLPSIILIGDSTVRNGRGDGRNGQWGWGAPLKSLFRTAQVNVVNRAVGGLSSRTYYTGYWENTLSYVKPGDVVMMQFGHNDPGAINDDRRARGTLWGIGEETQHIDNLLTKQPETVHTYGWYLRQFIEDTLAKGATPIVVSPVPRKGWDMDQTPPQHHRGGRFCDWARQVATNQGVGFIDLNAHISDRYTQLGPDQVEHLFADKHTHTSKQGALINAQCVTGLLQTLDPVFFNRLLTRAGQNTKKAPETYVVKATPKPANRSTQQGLKSAESTQSNLPVEDERPILDDSNETQQVADDDRLPTLYILGDSTVRNRLPKRGWGEELGPWFDAEKINIVNRAIGGRSTRTFMREGRWQSVYDLLKPGDFVIMQFGHNDVGRVGDPRFKRRPALPGTGDETQDVTLDDGTVETVHTYGWYLKQYCLQAKEKGATAIVCSPIPHKDGWKNGRFTPDFKSHRKWAREAALSTGAHFIDLTAIIGNGYQKIGEQAVEGHFEDARTHTNATGAAFNAKCVVAGIKALRGYPMNALFSEASLQIKAAKRHAR